MTDLNADYLNTVRAMEPMIVTRIEAEDPPPYETTYRLSANVEIRDRATEDQMIAARNTEATRIREYHAHWRPVTLDRARELYRQLADTSRLAWWGVAKP